MRTRIVLCVLLSLAITPALAQPAQDILEGELAAEARLYSEAFADLRSARENRASRHGLEDAVERVSRHRRNMAELAREIARAEGDLPGTSSPAKGSSDWLIPVEPAKRRYPEWLVPGSRNAE